ncbi:recombination regulator RecX [Hathewaya histolytica]|uniref:recombination regulator RecX n=1 Tax=Hathewaya histolytica TaxID=1498 RepID=UPI003B6833BC
MNNIITKIEVQKFNKERVNIYVDDEFFIGCSMELIYKEGIKKGEAVHKEKLQSIIIEDNFMKAKSRSLRYLGKSHKTEKEVVGKLKEEGYEISIIDRTICFLKEYDFINDERYVELFIKEKLKKWGENRIKYELLRKGIEEKLVLDKIYSIDSEEKNKVLYEVALKKYNSLIKSENDSFKINRKLNDYLLRRGYGFDEIKSVINKIVKAGD